MIEPTIRDIDVLSYFKNYMVPLCSINVTINKALIEFGLEILFLFSTCLKNVSIQKMIGR
jgi:hypothetical protein